MIHTINNQHGPTFDDFVGQQAVYTTSDGQRLIGTVEKVERTNQPYRTYDGQYRTNGHVTDYVIRFLNGTHGRIGGDHTIETV